MTTIRSRRTTSWVKRR
uniref:ZAC n=1 Tax=Arundo donax TaxID=35708 RepID=A0A0A9DB33_ARUDO